MTMRRGLLWGILVLALVAVAVATAVQRLKNPAAEALPLLGRVPAFTLTNQDGKTVRLSDLAGRPWVADFVFTKCPSSCPILSTQMAQLDRFLDQRGDAVRGVRLVSISVDPVHDTPPVLARYAASFKASRRWLFLTGGRDEVYGLITQGFKLGVDDTPAPQVKGAEPIIHSTRFVLVDGEGNIRGYYGAFTDGAMEQLRNDLLRLAGAD